MGGIFFAIFKKSFRIIKLRFLETTETALACNPWIVLIIKAIACGVELSKSGISFCDRVMSEAPQLAIAVCSFDSSKIAADSANHYRILLAYLPVILKQNLNITKLRVAKFKTIPSIVSIATQKATFFNVTNSSTNFLIFKFITKLLLNSKKLNLIEIILARYRPQIFT
ncbi:MAG: hypothetical protein RMX68_004640 [Aulosira sp. ZfuVER01]|nr:hypothetical protein [Aulosira sp. ZfuVER01]MDZ7997550.1 hypothetical protein [Aulosira sp. DedVER01a]MDZ8055586.1 hypothetical protein [Aulosira sp. ZfuCHP01]